MSDIASLEPIIEFKKYLEKDFRPAYKEIGGLDSKNRVHIQKLLYVSLLNRFDSSLDEFFRINSNLDIEGLGSTIKDFMDTPVSTSMLIESLKEGISYLEDRRRSAIMSDIARKKHVDKARLMLKTIGFDDKSLNSSRVNNAKGAILKTFKTTTSNAPASILGFIDWLYCRRNILVHSGGGSTFDQSVIERFKRDYKVNLTTIRLSYGALSIADNFYSDLLKSIENFNGNIH